MKHYIFSDLHINDPRVDHALVYATFANISKDDRVILNGDIIEGWTSDYRQSVIKHFNLVKLILSKTTVYVVGNHDSFMKWVCLLNLGHIKFYYPYCLMEVDERKWYIEHGHLSGQYGSMFRFLDRIDNNTIFTDVVSHVTHWKMFSMQNKSRNAKDRMKADAIEKGRKMGAEVVIVGHDHLCANYQSGNVRLVDAGTAVKTDKVKFTYAVYENGGFEIVNA